MSTAAPFFTAGPFVFRPIDEVVDLPRIGAWLADPEVGRWWEGVTVTYDEAFVREHFLAEEWVVRAIVELDGAPIGFQQWYSLDAPGEEVSRAEYGLDDEPPGVFGIDQFVGESRLHGQGIGSAQVRAVSDWLLGPDGPQARMVVTDPVVENERAVRAYEKAGFVKVRVLRDHETIDGAPRDSWLMERRPPR